MRRQTVIALALAAVLGLLAVYLANVFLTSNEQRAAADGPKQMARIAVAALPLDYGVQITPDKVKFIEYPAASLPPGSYSSIAQLLPAGKSRIALRPIAVNEPILADKLAGEGQNASIAALLPDGMRAAAVRINDVSGVAGFVQPNDAVDVLITREQGGNSEAQVTDVLLQNIKVLAIGQDAKGAGGKPTLAKTATLEVNPLDAQKLALAQQVGALSLVLRKPGEEQNIPGIETVSLADLRYSLSSGMPYRRVGPTAYASAPAPRAARAAPRRVVRNTAPAAPVRPRSSVQVVRGTEGNNYEVGDYGS